MYKIVIYILMDNVKNVMRDINLILQMFVQKYLKIVQYLMLKI